MQTLITGSAGFIGAALALRLLQRGDAVIGIDNLTDYYDISLKQARLQRLSDYRQYTDVRADLADRRAVTRLFKQYQPQQVINLAAQAGVRYSLENPYAYIDSNIMGFMNILEACREHKIEHLVYASSSSVYGANHKLPFSVQDSVDHPISLYAASKKSNELMAHCYSHLYQLPTTGLRFFTVYGPWGRPDMAYFRFTEKILAEQSIDVYNYGKHRRDFTYIDDVTEGVVRVMDHPARSNPKWDSRHPDPASSLAPYRIFNIGNQHPVQLMDFIETLEKCLGKTAKKRFLPQQAGDVADTYADVSALQESVAYHPNTPIAIGIERFVAWYRDYYQV